MNLITIYIISGTQPDKRLSINVRISREDDTIEQTKGLIKDIVSTLLFDLVTDVNQPDEHLMKQHISDLLCPFYTAKSLKELFDLPTVSLLNQRKTLINPKYVEGHLLLVENMLSIYNYHFYLDIQPINFKTTLE